MSDSHYAFDRTGGRAGGYRLGAAHEALDRAMILLVAERDTMTQMLETGTDGSQDAHFVEHLTAYGFGTAAEAHQAYSELNSVVGKLTNNASQTVVYDAIKQFLARLRS